MLCAYKTLLQNRRIVLASASERRKEILGGLVRCVNLFSPLFYITQTTQFIFHFSQGLPFDVILSPFDEDANRPNITDPKEFTKWTASQKALAIVNEFKNHSNPPDFIIGADTVVFLHDKIIGKPKDSENAVEMLKMYV